MSSPGPLRRWALAATLVGFVIALAGIPARATYGAQVSGDEPYYLLTALSLANDADLDIANQLAAGAYRPFHEVDINPQTVPLDRTGREVSPHDPLLAVLLAGPMALGGWVVAKIALAGVAAATAGATVWFAVHRMTVPPAVAGPVVVAGFAGLPLAGYGTQVYPEMPAALTVVAGVSAVTAPRLSWTSLAGTLAAIVALPWWSVKYVPVAAVLGAVLLWRARRRRTQAAVVAGVAVMAAVSYLAAHQWIYGGWTAYASGDHFVDTGEFSVMGTSVDLTGRARRLTGLLFDRQFGLVIWAPVWILLPPALARAVRRRPSLATSVSLGVIAAGWLNASFIALTMHGWWLPGRQLVVVLPVALAMVAGWVADGDTRRLALVGALGGVGVLNWLWLAVEASTGRRTLIVDFSETAAPAVRLLAPLFPDGMRHATLDTALLIGWTMTLLALYWPPRRGPGGRIVRALPGARLVSKNSS